MTHRRGVLGAAVVLPAIVAGALWMARRSTVAADIPNDRDQNVLLVTIDTLRADALGCDGGPARTPAMDGLAAGGLRFTFAHAHAVITLPSHASILTGLYAYQHGYRENSGYRLKAGTPTLATLLKAQGYDTGAFVGAFPLDARFGLTPGFDVYDGRFDVASPGGVFLLPERPAGDVVRAATSWIAGRAGRRWFAWVHVFDPHAPYRPPAPLASDYQDRPYYGEVAAVDAALAPLFESLRQSTRQTLIVLTGDHGEALGDHGETTHGLFAYESTLRVPLIVSRLGPSGATSRFPAGEVVPDPARHVDILPTILDVLRIAPPADLPGTSLRTKAAREAGGTRASYFEAMSTMLEFGWAPLRGVLAGREKLIDLPVPELYDLSADPAESRNLHDTRPDRQRVLSVRLSDFNASMPGGRQQEDPAVLARLQALGYVSGGAAPKERYTEADDPKGLVALDRMLHEAVALDEAGRTADASALYEKILAERPDMMSASRHLAFNHWKTGNVTAAVATLKAALSAGTPTPGAQVQLATYLAETGRPRDAIEILTPLAAGTPDMDTLNALGIAYGRSGQFKEALHTFERSLALDSSNAMTLENIGTVHLQAGDAGQAQRAFEAALRANPSSSQAHAGLAVIALQRADRATGVAHLRKAVDLDPSNFDALYNLSMQLLRAGQTAEARPYIEQFVRAAPRALYARDIDELSVVLKQTK